VIIPDSHPAIIKTEQAEQAYQPTCRLTVQWVSQYPRINDYPCYE